MPVFVASSPRTRRSASRPPAEAPIPTMGNGGRASGTAVAVAATARAGCPRRREGDLARRVMDVGLSFREGRIASAVAYRESVRDAAEGVRRAWGKLELLDHGSTSDAKCAR